MTPTQWHHLTAVPLQRCTALAAIQPLRQASPTHPTGTTTSLVARAAAHAAARANRRRRVLGMVSILVEEVRNGRQRAFTIIERYNRLGPTGAGLL